MPIGTHGPAEAEVDFSDMDNIPLFMKRMPTSEQGQIENNPALEALQSLVYEGGPEATAANLKEEANIQYKAKRYKEASGFYSQAIQELGQDLAVNTLRTLLANRAACQLELQNYGSCIKDCASVFSTSIDPLATEEERKTYEATSRKALFRCAKALNALGKYDEALDALERLGEMSEKPDVAASALLESIKKKLAAGLKVTQEREAREDAKRRQDLALITRLKELKISLPPSWTYDQARSLAPGDFAPPQFSDYRSSTTILFPVFLLRPYYSPPMRDFIPNWSDDTTLNEQLQVLTQQDPSFGSLEYFTITKKGRILKIGRKLSLAQVCNAAHKEGDGIELVGGWSLEVYCLPSERAKEWAEEMKVDLRKRGLMG